MRACRQSGLFRVHFICGGRVGARQLWAPSAGSASRLIRENASSFGLPHEHVEILSTQRLEVREADATGAAVTMRRAFTAG